MKIVRPMTVNDAALISSNVPETDYTAFSEIVAYAIGDRARWVAADSHRIYESLIAGNLNKAPEVSSLSALLVAAGARSFTVPSGLSFAAGESVEITSPVDKTVSLTGTVTSYAGTTLIVNVTDITGGGLIAYWIIKRPGLWLEISATNRWAMFDGSVTSQTSNADSIDVDIRANGRVDTVALFNIDATTARVTMTDANDGVVFDQTQTLAYNSGITDWYAYFFEPVLRRSDVIFKGMPAYANATIGITLSNSGNSVRCGAAVLGQSKSIGGTQYGVSIGIQDFSKKDRDDFGNWNVLERAFSKRGRFSLWIDNNNLDSIVALLASYRAEPVVYLGTDSYTSTFIYGFYKDFSTVISYPNASLMDIEIEGLT